MLVACVTEIIHPAKVKRAPIGDTDDFFDEEPADTEDAVAPVTVEDSGAFTAPRRPSSGAHDAGLDAAVDDASTPPTGLCPGAVGPGDLAITELMIASNFGSGDKGEWVEITSQRSCRLSLNGLTVESPRGTTQKDTITIAEPFELAPGATFIVAGSADRFENHGLPGKVFAWDSADVLKNDGDTIRVKLGAVVIDELTYPSFSNLGFGSSIAFPSDCPSGVRSDWARWSLAFAPFGDTFFPQYWGTPNATNDDIACY
jgi:hypothetical protein